MLNILTLKKFPAMSSLKIRKNSGAETNQTEMENVNK